MDRVPPIPASGVKFWGGLAAHLWSRVRATISGTPEQICGNQQNWPPFQRAHFHPQHHGGKNALLGEKGEGWKAGEYMPGAGEG